VSAELATRLDAEIARREKIVGNLDPVNAR